MMLVLLFLIPVLGFLHPVIGDADIWWHLRTGQWILEHGALPTTDPFSIHGAGKEWIAYSWLFEVLIYGLYHVFDVFGVMLYQLMGSLAITVAMYWFIARREPRFAVSTALAALAVVATCRDFTPRPWLFTILFFIVTLAAVLTLREGKETKVVWALPVLYALWANIHIQFIYGLIVLGLACVAPIVDALYGRTYYGDDPRSLSSRGWRRLVGLTAGCVLATLANPHHVHLYRIIFELAAQTGMYQYTQELQAPSFRTFADWALLGLGMMTAMTLGRTRRFSAFKCLLFAVAVFFSFRSMRDAWFLAVVALALHPAGGSEADSAREFPFTRLRVALVSVFLLLGIVGTIESRDFSREHVEAEMAKRYPVAAATAVEQSGYEGPLYNHFNWGGYLIWRLPRLPVSMDGRANVHGDERIWRSMATWNGGHDWLRDPELDASRLVIANRDAALTSLLRRDLRFHAVYEDDTAVVFAARSKDPAMVAGRDASRATGNVSTQ